MTNKRVEVMVVFFFRDPGSFCEHKSRFREWAEEKRSLD
jgi:hypothetical protein